jgi:hypothetical protein
MKKMCSICKKKEAFLMQKSLITKIKTYYCHDCIIAQSKIWVNVGEFEKEKPLP